MPTGHYLTEEQQSQIVRDYLAGKTGVEIAAAIGLSKTVCYPVLKRRGITRRGYSEVQRQHALNESYFERIDTEEKAYWLGFVTADGYVFSDKKRGRLIVNLERKDRGHLGKMLAALQSALPILDYEYVGTGGTRRIVSRATFNSRKLSDDLIHLGVVPKKSLIVRPWIGPDGLMRHYWRGVVDGDGSVLKFRQHEKGKNGKTYSWDSWSIQLPGSQWICQAFADFVAFRIGVAKNALPLRTIFQVRYGGRILCQKIARELYADATVFLERKCLVAQELIRSK